jgi:hypothetical protein
MAVPFTAGGAEYVTVSIVPVTPPQSLSGELKRNASSASVAGTPHTESGNESSSIEEFDLDKEREKLAKWNDADEEDLGNCR